MKNPSQTTKYNSLIKSRTDNQYKNLFKTIESRSISQQAKKSTLNLY